ncbi:MAG: two-component system response regulator [Kofleriaceae bacterium]
MISEKLVVIVDDEPGVCELLQDVFEDHGYMVRVATDGEQALRLLSQLEAPPCVVILDLIMPVIDGGAVYRAMQADPTLSKVSIVITTSDPSRAPPGAMTMKKPVNLALLIDAVNKCCEQPVASRRATTSEPVAG